MHKVEGRAVECSVDYKNALAPVTAAIVKLYICTLCKAAAADTGFKDAIHVQRHLPLSVSSAQDDHVLPLCALAAIALLSKGIIT
eukprot:20131-Heterococcus_DN1.PRE.1